MDEETKGNSKHDRHFSLLPHLNLYSLHYRDNNEAVDRVLFEFQIVHFILLCFQI